MPRHLESPVCRTGVRPGGSNRIMAAPGQWLASRKVTLMPSTIAGAFRSYTTSRSRASLSRRCTSRAVIVVQCTKPTATKALES